MTHTQAECPRRRLILLGSALALTVLSVHQGSAAVITFQKNLAGFNALAGTPPVSIDFDGIFPGDDVAGTTIEGVTFTSPPSNTLDVVEGLATFTPGGFTGVIDATTNKLFPTSGENVLSPGGEELVPGSNPGEKDSLQLDFATPLPAFGLDVLFQSFDFAAFSNFQVFDASLNLIASGGIAGSGAGPGAPGGSAFIGFVSNDPSTNISRIVFSENDGNAEFPDSNIGFDTFRFVPPPTVRASEPAGAAVLAAALVLFGLVRRRS